MRCSPLLRQAVAQRLALVKVLVYYIGMTKKRDRTIMNFQLSPAEMRALDRSVAEWALRNGKRANRSEFVRAKLAKYLRA